MIRAYKIILYVALYAKKQQQTNKKRTTQAGRICDLQSEVEVQCQEFLGSLCVHVGNVRKNICRTSGAHYLD